MVGKLELFKSGRWWGRLVTAFCLTISAERLHAQGPAAPPEPPSDLAESVCRPTFQIDGHLGQTGTAFVLRAPGSVDGQLLVSAHHLFGLATATYAGMPWSETPRRVVGASCRSLTDGAQWRAGAAVALAGVHAFRSVTDVDDIAILPISAGPMSRLIISAKPVVAGDPVWLLAQSQNPLQAARLSHQARVLKDDGALLFVYDDSRLDTANISGAPVVDAEGRVVGVNVAVGRLTNGALVGVADDLATLQAAVASAR